MKDKYNVILILVSSSEVNSLFWRFIKILDLICSSFFPEFQVFLGYTIVKLHLNHCKAHLVLSTSLSFYHSFITGVLTKAQHGCPSRTPFILQLFFKISLEAKIRQAILKNKHGAQHMFFPKEFKYSSCCIPKCNSLYLIFWDGVMSFLIISLRGSWFTSYQEWDMLNPSISSLELSWVVFHLMPSLRMLGNVAEN